MDDIKIEGMQETDFQEVSNVFRTVFNAEGEKWIPETSLEHIKEYYQKEFSFLAKDGEKIIGAILGRKDTEMEETYVLIDTFVVLNEYRKKGVGKALWNELTKVAKEMNYDGLILLTNPSWESYRFYKDMGFKETGWIQVYKNFKE